MKTYNRHSIALNDEDQKTVTEIKNKTGEGTTAIFKAGMKALKPIRIVPVVVEEE